MSITLTHSLPACPTRLGAETLAPGTATVFRILAKIAADIPRPGSPLLAHTKSTEDLCRDASCAKVSWSARCSSRPPAHRLRAERARKAALRKHLPTSAALSCWTGHRFERPCNCKDAFRWKPIEGGV